MLPGRPFFRLLTDGINANGSLLEQDEFHHNFPFNSRQLMPVKTTAVFDELLKERCITMSLLGVTEGFHIVKFTPFL